jgi:hypothetical protein
VTASLRENLRKSAYSKNGVLLHKDICVFPRVSLVLLALLSCIWITLLFDFGGAVHHLGELLNLLEND